MRDTLKFFEKFRKKPISFDAIDYNFYEEFVEYMLFEHIQMATFPNEPESGKVSGALVKSDSNKGIIIYLNANPDMNSVLEKIESQGGKILMKKGRLVPKLATWPIFSTRRETE